MMTNKKWKYAMENYYRSIGRPAPWQTTAYDIRF